MEPTRRGQDRLPGASEGSMLIGWSARSSYQAVIANSRGWPWRPSDWEQGGVVEILGAAETSVSAARKADIRTG